MINRYANRQIFKNDYEEYENQFRERNLKFINQYSTPNYALITAAKLGRISLERYTWKAGDRFYKLAYEYYGDAEDWWVIAQFNGKPTESHIKIGETILIPTPIAEVVNILKG